MILRGITGVAFVSLVIFSIVWNPISAMVLFGLVTLLSLFELQRLFFPERTNLTSVFGSLLALSAYFAVAFSVQKYAPFIQSSLPFLILLFLLPLVSLFSKLEHPLKRVAVIFAGVLLIALPLGLLNGLSRFQFGKINQVFLLAFFVFIWVSDTFAYLVGSAIGKHRLFERISPKKSWEGSIGGALFALLAAEVFTYFLPDFGRIQWYGFALIVVVFGTFGDLSESQLKRSLKVKDSGLMLPGHGGILDRFDSTFLAAPMVYIYFELLKIFV